MDYTNPERKNSASPKLLQAREDSRLAERSEVQWSGTSTQPWMSNFEPLMVAPLRGNLVYESDREARPLPNLYTHAHSAIPEANLPHDQVPAGLVGSASDNSKKLFFKPLNKHLTREQVLECLERFGRVDYLRVPFSNKKKKNLGNGFVIFGSSKVSDMLHRHQIKTKIADKAVGFYKFDLLKFKSKKMEEALDSSRNEVEFIEDLKFTSIAPQSEIKPDFPESEHKGHFMKPTESRFFTSKRCAAGGTRYGLNLEMLKMKTIRDTKSSVLQFKKESTSEADQPKY